MNEIRRYCPANGTEGSFFFDDWCAQCARDKPMSEGKSYDACEDSEICEIIAASFRGPVDEWIYDENENPKCTAFIAAGEKIPERDTKTIDMFEEKR